MKRIALITGGTSGIGLGIAKALAKEYDLALGYKSNDERANSAKKLILEESGQAKIYRAPLFSYEDAEALLHLVRSDFGRGPDILIHSAGHRHERKLFAKTDFAEIDSCWRVHLLVCISLSKLVLPEMYDRKFGRIINMSSAGTKVNPKIHKNSDYVAVKSGVEGFTRALALEVAHRGVTVNAIAPGLVDTPMTEELLEELKEKNREPRMANIDDVGALAKFLCSSGADYMTGEIIPVDGGGLYV